MRGRHSGTRKCSGQGGVRRTKSNATAKLQAGTRSRKQGGLRTSDEAQYLYGRGGDGRREEDEVMMYSEGVGAWETTTKWVPSAQGRLLPGAIDPLGLARFAGAKVLAPARRWEDSAPQSHHPHQSAKGPSMSANWALTLAVPQVHCTRRANGRTFAMARPRVTLPPPPRRLFHSILR